MVVETAPPPPFPRSFLTRLCSETSATPQLLDEKELMAQLRQVREMCLPEWGQCSAWHLLVSWLPSISSLSTLLLWLRTGDAGWSSLLTLTFSSPILLLSPPLGP